MKNNWMASNIHQSWIPKATTWSSHIHPKSFKMETKTTCLLIYVSTYVPIYLSTYLLFSYLPIYQNPPSRAPKSIQNPSKWKPKSVPRGFLEGFWGGPRGFLEVSGKCPGKPKASWRGPGRGGGPRPSQEPKRWGTGLPRVAPGPPQLVAKINQNRYQEPSKRW